MRKLIVVIGWLLFLGCEERPEGVMSPDKMVDFMVDMHLAESTINNDVRKFREKESKLQLYNDVFKKHNVTKAEMDSSLNYYLSEANDYKKIYNRVLERLEQMHLDAEAGKFQDTREFLFADLGGDLQKADYTERDSVVAEIWRMPRSFSLLEKGDKSTVEFSFLSDSTNKFNFLVLKGNFKLYLNDCSDNPETVLRVTYSDGTSDEVSVPLVKDAAEHPIRLRLVVNSSKSVLRIEGELVGHDKCLSSKSVEITDVRLYKMKGYKSEVIEINENTDSIPNDSVNETHELDSFPFNPFQKR